MQGPATRVSAFRVTLRAAVDKILQVGLPYLQNIQLRDGLQTAVAMAGVAAAWRILARCIELQRMMTAAAEQQALATEQLATAVIALRSTVEGHIYQAKAAEFIALARTHAVASDWDEPYRGTDTLDEQQQKPSGASSQPTPQPPRPPLQEQGVRGCHARLPPIKTPACRTDSYLTMYASSAASRPSVVRVELASRSSGAARALWNAPVAAPTREASSLHSRKLPVHQQLERQSRWSQSPRVRWSRRTIGNADN